MQRRRSTRGLTEGSSVSVSARALIIRLPLEGSAAQCGINPQMHEPALVAALVPDNNGNRRGDLFRGDIKTRLVQRQIAVKVPADPNVTKLEGSCDAATHVRKI
jgi:hypothetical protein